jgi:hypothetical protein
MVVRFNIEKKSSSFDGTGAMVGTTDGCVILGNNANRSRNDFVGGLTGAVVGVCDIGLVGAAVGDFDGVVVGAFIGLFVDVTAPGSSNTT